MRSDPWATHRCPSYSEVGPHGFEPARRWFNRGRCRACYFHEDTHPLSQWSPARPLGDMALPYNPFFVDYGDSRPVVGPQECYVVLHHREADAVLAVLEQAVNANMEPGIGLRVEDAVAAGVKLELARQGVSC